MRSEVPGTSDRTAEVTNVSPHGFWMLVDDEELFLPFTHFPWFREATIGEIGNVRLLRAEHLQWPDLDVDLTVDSIRHPERYPVIFPPGRGSVSMVRETRRSGRRGVDVVEDVLRVLQEIRWLWQTNPDSAPTSELRRKSIGIVAEKEHSRGRFKNLRSAERSIHDACVRRMRPRINTVEDFDRLVREWLRGKSPGLREAVSDRAASDAQLERVKAFFASK